MVIRETSDDGRPITATDPASPYARIYREMAARLWQKVAGAETMTRTPPKIVVE